MINDVVILSVTLSIDIHTCIFIHQQHSLLHNPCDEDIKTNLGVVDIEEHT